MPNKTPSLPFAATPIHIATTTATPHAAASDYVCHTVAFAPEASVYVYDNNSSHGKQPLTDRRAAIPPDAPGREQEFGAYLQLIHGLLLPSDAAAAPDHSPPISTSNINHPNNNHPNNNTTLDTVHDAAAACVPSNRTTSPRTASTPCMSSTPATSSTASAVTLMTGSDMIIGTASQRAPPSRATDGSNFQTLQRAWLQENINLPDFVIPPNCRSFVIKSYSEDDIHKAIKVQGARWQYFVAINVRVVAHTHTHTHTLSLSRSRSRSL
jgi:hypothetical protein